MMGLSTHILDTALGRPATGVRITLHRGGAAGWHDMGEGKTDADGRCRDLLGEAPLETGNYKLCFHVAEYFREQGSLSLYPFVEIVFTVRSVTEHYHIPLLLTANGYTTYRGS